MEMMCFFLFESEANQDSFGDCVISGFPRPIMPFLLNNKRYRFNVQYELPLWERWQFEGNLSIIARQNYVLKLEEGITQFVYSYTLQVPTKPDCDYYRIEIPEYAMLENDPTWFDKRDSEFTKVYYDRDGSILIPLKDDRELLFAIQDNPANGFPVLKAGRIFCRGTVLNIEDSGDRDAWVRAANGYWVDFWRKDS